MFLNEFSKQSDQRLIEIDDYNANNYFFSLSNNSYDEYEFDVSKTDYLQSLEQLKKNISQDSKFRSTYGIQKVLDENINSLQNSISIFYNMHKSQIDDINRISEEYNFALAQLNRENERITQNKNKVQSEMELIESIHSELAKTASSIHDVHNSIEMSPNEKVKFLYNKNIIKYEKKCQKISCKHQTIKHNLKNLKMESKYNKNQIKFFKEREINLTKEISEVIAQMTKIIEAKKKYNTNLDALFKTKELIIHFKFLIKQNKTKNNLLLNEEKFLLRKINNLDKKEEILKIETKEINDTQNIINQRYEDIKRTSQIQDDVEKPLILFYNEIKDNIQEELQKEVNLNHQLSFFSRKEVTFFNSYTSNDFYDESQINGMKKELNDLDKECMLLHEKIFNQSNSNIKMLNQKKEIENKLSAQLNEIYKLNSHHNGNVDVLYDYIMGRSDLEYIKKLQKQIIEKKEIIKNKKEKYLKKYDALINVIENFMANYSLL
ncbi:hypothetical protein M9Y10_005503 [Tritrichomonas musculus]|uniref:Uncharacterized protein n=1 Tax=Tritrichomonas musculus TaxID=1915356 RepID=A0ABR2JBZ9_9EUKA